MTAPEREQTGCFCPGKWANPLALALGTQPSAVELEMSWDPLGALVKMRTSASAPECPTGRGWDGEEGTAAPAALCESAAGTLAMPGCTSLYSKSKVRRSH